MFKATEGKLLPTTITGSLPRPSWFTEVLGDRDFVDAMVSISFREQYEDAVAVFLQQQEVAGLDIVTDGDARFANEVGGQSWGRYPTQHMAGFDHRHPLLRPAAVGLGFPRGHILHDYSESRVIPPIIGPVGRGTLQYAEVYKAAQRLTAKPVKFGAPVAEVIGSQGSDQYYPDVRSRLVAISEALNAEFHAVADAGCPALQVEEPQLHLAAARGQLNDVLTVDFLVELFNNTVKGLRGKTEVWAHTCWGNPAQQRMFAQVQRYGSALSALNRLDADVLTFEARSSGSPEFAAIGEAITGKKIAIGVIDHHTLQVESPAEVAETIRAALRHIPAETLVISTDCGMGREGMSRRHAFYKMVSLVLGTNIVREELCIPQATSLAADERLSLIPTAM